MCRATGSKFQNQKVPERSRGLSRNRQPIELSLAYRQVFFNPHLLVGPAPRQSEATEKARCFPQICRRAASLLLGQYWALISDCNLELPTALPFRKRGPASPLTPHGPHGPTEKHLGLRLGLHRYVNF